LGPDEIDGKERTIVPWGEEGGMKAKLELQSLLQGSTKKVCSKLLLSEAKEL